MYSIALFPVHIGYLFTPIFVVVISVKVCAVVDKPTESSAAFRVDFLPVTADEDWLVFVETVSQMCHAMEVDVIDCDPSDSEGARRLPEKVLSPCWHRRCAGGRFHTSLLRY